MPQLLSTLFGDSAFAPVELTAVFQHTDYVPMPLAQIRGLFTTVSIRTRQIAIAKQTNRYALIPTSPIGAPPVELELKPQDIRNFGTRRLAKGSTILAESVQGLLLAPTFEAVAGLQQEVASRAVKIREDIDLTLENMRLNCVCSGTLVDSDGSVLENYFTNWGETPQAVFHFDFADETPHIRAMCQAVKRAMALNGKGGFVSGATSVHALCGSTFYDALVMHPEVERTYLGYSAAADLRGEIPGDFSFGGIIWHDYRPADDGVTLTPFTDDECRFFPVGGRDVFQEIHGPAEFAPFVNQPGQDVYAMTIPDRDRQAWQRVEAYTYPLFVCLRPKMLMSGDTAAAAG